MMTKQEGHGCFAKQFSKVGSMAGIIKLSHLHSQHAYSSGENLSPRSVLEQTALSGLAIAIDLEEKQKKKLSHTQENVRFFCKQSILHMISQEAKAQQNAILGRSLSRERLNHKSHEEREAVSDESIVGLRMVASLYPMLHMSSQGSKGHEKLIMGRSVSRERMKHMVHMTDEEREACPDSSNVGASTDGERKQDLFCTSHMDVSLSSSSPPLGNAEKVVPTTTTCKSHPGSGDSRGWLLKHFREEDERFPATSGSMEESIFYYANPSSATNSHNVVDDDDHTCSPVEDFLKLCFFCKCHLGVGKDIYMYRGDQAFCSAECRYQKIMNDEFMGSSAS